MREYDFSAYDDVDDIVEVIASQDWSSHMQLAYLAYCCNAPLDPRVEEFDDDLLQQALDDEVPPGDLVGYLKQQAEREKAAQAEQERRRVGEAVAAAQRQNERAKRRTQAKRLTKTKPSEVEAEIISVFRTWDAEQRDIFVARLQLEQDNVRAQENKAAVERYRELWQAAQAGALQYSGRFPPVRVYGRPSGSTRPNGGRSRRSSRAPGCAEKGRPF